MKDLKYKTKIQQGANILTTAIPKDISSFLELEKGKHLKWILNENGIVTIEKTE